MEHIQMGLNTIKDHQWDQTLAHLYGKDAVPAQRERYMQALEHFYQSFGDAHVDLFSAPGRSEIIGNHTDHQGGKVLGCAVNLDTLAVVRPRDDAKVSIRSAGFETFTVYLADLCMREKEKDTSIALVRGILFRMQELGFAIGGFDAYLHSQVPIGSGLSSSASFEMVITAILNAYYNDNKIDSITLAQIAQYSENHYFGKPCGLLDQLACGYGGLIAMDFADAQHPQVRSLHFPTELEEYALVMVNSHGSHANLTHEYAAIPQEMHKVAHVFGYDRLGQLDMHQFYEAWDSLRVDGDDRSILRAHHFFQENIRVDQAEQALENNDIRSFFAAILASGVSSFSYLQNVYPHHDPQHQPLSIAQALAQAMLTTKGAWRLHGGGFAGTIIAFVPKSMLETFTDKMDQTFGQGSTQELSIRAVGAIKVSSL